MHPEIQQEVTGRCPKCGMRLVSVETSKKNLVTNNDQGLGILTWKSYFPLIVIIFLILLVSTVISLTDFQRGKFSIFQSISYFMIAFFITFSGFKLMDLKGFAEGYSTYDLLAQKVFTYGYVYPFFELGFGLLMLAGIKNQPLLWSEIVVMSFSGLGVVRKLMLRESIKCVCLGTFLKIPLTNITLFEDLGMSALALILILNGA